MNNVINNNYSRAAQRKNNRYNETSGERLISFFCIIIAFFENEAVSALCRAIGVAALAVGTYFYASAVMSGALSPVGILLYGALLIGASAIVFNTKAIKGE